MSEWNAAIDAAIVEAKKWADTKAVSGSTAQIIASGMNVAAESIMRQLESLKKPSSTEDILYRMDNNPNIFG